MATSNFECPYLPLFFLLLSPLALLTFPTISYNHCHQFLNLSLYHQHGYPYYLALLLPYSPPILQVLYILIRPIIDNLSLNAILLFLLFLLDTSQGCSIYKVSSLNLQYHSLRYFSLQYLSLQYFSLQYHSLQYFSFQYLSLQSQSSPISQPPVSQSPVSKSGNSVPSISVLISLSLYYGILNVVIQNSSRICPVHSDLCSQYSPEMEDAHLSSMNPQFQVCS